MITMIDQLAIPCFGQQRLRRTRDDLRKKLSSSHDILQLIDRFLRPVSATAVQVAVEDTAVETN